MVLQRFKVILPSIQGLLSNFANRKRKIMLDAYYNDIILAGWTTALILGLCMLLSNVPDIPTYLPYIRSKRILGIAYIIFGMAISQFTFFDLRNSYPTVAVALPLSYYYLEGILFGMSFCSLLDRHYICRRQKMIDFGFYSGFLILAWSGALLAAGVMRTVMLICASVWFFTAASIISVRFFKIYRASIRKLDDFYSDNIAVFVRWLHKSTYGIIFFGLCGSVLAFAPRWGNAIFMSAGIVMFVYIYISFQNYILNYRNVEIAVEENITSRSCDTRVQTVDLGEGIERWVSSGGYRMQGLTLEDLARELGSNRSYVSAYINSTFNCNFREWINALRIDYSKTLLAEQSFMTIEKVSEQSGFSTSAYFCRLFSKREGMTPTKWRESTIGGVGK